MFTDSLLSTITCESKITNINYQKEADLIKKIIASLDIDIIDSDIIVGGDEKTRFDIIILNTNKGMLKIPNTTGVDNNDLIKEYTELIESGVKNYHITDNIIRIGCNYGEFITNEYIELNKPKKKSNRGRKKKIKKPSTRKQIGNGRYFNSQITFSIQENEKYYHLKLFTNGTVQVPFVSDENVEIITPTIIKIINLVSQYDTVKVDNEKNCDIIYIKSIMRNYKFNIINEDLFLDLNKFQKLVANFKHYFENDKKIIDKNFDIPEIDSNLYITNWELLSKLPISLIKHSSERYVGFILKFFTPTSDKDKKQSTVKIFSSGKFNLDGCNSREEANIIKNILHILVNIGSEYIIYEKTKYD